MKSTLHKLAYQKLYNARPIMKKRRAEENAARRAALRAGTAHKGDDTAVDHIRALDDRGTNAPSNLRVVNAEKNKGWRKGTSTYDPAKGKFNK